MTSTRPLFAIIFAALCPLLLTAQASHPLLQRPSFNGNLIVFSYAGDLWTGGPKWRTRLAPDRRDRH